MGLRDGGFGVVGLRAWVRFGVLVLRVWGCGDLGFRDWGLTVRDGGFGDLGFRVYRCKA